MKAYYNEYDKFAAAWLRSLIQAGLIMDGEVDERSIVDVRPEDLEGYDRCHFFAGIGGWELALQLAGWDGPVWTGSCPCQPFSSAGKGKGTADERHLWPEFARLIGECKPATIFGEQVASKAGREWFDGVSTDLEDMGYAAAAADLCAASKGAPHIRQRLFWLADAGCQGRDRKETQARQKQGQPLAASRTGDSCVPRSGLADAEMSKCDRDGAEQDWTSCGSANCSGLGDTIDTRLEGHGGLEQVDDSQRRQSEERHSTSSSWNDFDIIRCVEPTKEPGRYVEKRRRVESGLVPLAHGLPARVGRLRGYGNAIVPQVAAEFIQACMEC